MQGIGYAVAQRFASEGAQHVGLLDMPGERLTAAGVSFEQEFGRKAILLPCNVTKEEEVAAAFKQLIEAAGRCDVLVQAAGIVGQTNLRSHEVNTDNFQLVMDINVKGIFLCAKAVLPTMVEQKYGRIVNIASISGKERNVWRADNG